MSHLQRSRLQGHCPRCGHVVRSDAPGQVMGSFVTPSDTGIEILRTCVPCQEYFVDYYLLDYRSVLDED